MLGQPIVPAAADRGRRAHDRRAAGRDHRDRPGADAHADAPRARRRREVRRVLRRRAVDAPGRRPRDAVEHVPRVRRDRGVLPGRRARRSRTCAFTGRGDRVDLVERYAKEQGLFRPRRRPRAGVQRGRSSSTSRAVEPSLAGPKRPQDRVALPTCGLVRRAFREHGARSKAEIGGSWPRAARARRLPGGDDLERGEPTDAFGRLRRDRRDHVVHEHLEPVGDARRGAAREEGGRGGPRDEAVGEDLARARARASSPTTSIAPGSRRTSRSSGSRSSGTAARRASATPGPLPDEVAAAVDEGDLNVVAVLSGNRNFEGRIHPQVRASLPRVAAARASRTRSPGASTSTSRPTRSATGPDGTRLPPRPLAVARGGREAVARRGHRGAVHRRVRAHLGRRRALARAADARRARSTRGTRPRPTSREPPFFDDLGAPASRRHRGRARAGEGGRLDHDRPHLAGGLDQGGLAGGRYLIEHGVEPARLQLLRRAAREPRGDDARHVREHPAAQRARAGHRGAVDDAPADGRRDVGLRRGRAVPRRGRPARA